MNNASGIIILWILRTQTNRASQMLSNDVKIMIVGAKLGSQWLMSDLDLNMTIANFAIFIKSISIFEVFSRLKYGQHVIDLKLI